MMGLWVKNECGLLRTSWLLSRVLLVPVLLASAALAEEPQGTSAWATKAPTRELRVLTWPEYLDPALVDMFEREFKARVRFDYFESDDARDRFVVQSDGQGFEIAVLDSSAIASYQRRGWIRPIDVAQVPNLRHIDKAIDQAYPETSGYAVPYFWGTTGIAYRADLVPEPPRRWMDLFRPDAALVGRIMMIADSYDLIGMALKALGFSMNSDDPEQIEQATALLLEQKPALRGYGTLELGPESPLITGELVAAMSYSGDAAMLMEQHDAIRYRVPEEGGPIWIDYLTIGAQGQSDLALAFIDFLNRPEVAAQNARYLHYATPNRAAEALLPTEFLSDPLIYPPPETLARCEHYKPLSPEAVRQRVEVYSAIVHGR
ncbi:hypothetical protein CCR96_11470 [Halochromatium roseum]|nr:hypothetical protein [Halochromatium roseum]